MWQHRARMLRLCCWPSNNNGSCSSWKWNLHRRANIQRRPVDPKHGFVLALVAGLFCSLVARRQSDMRAAAPSWLLCVASAGLVVMLRRQQDGARRRRRGKALSVGVSCARTTSNSVVVFGRQRTVCRVVFGEPLFVRPFVRSLNHPGAN